MKLHLGCGIQKLDGYVNCDIDKDVSPDKIVNLEKKLPFKDNSVDKIYTKNTLEHIRNIIPLIKELHRICKNGAIINIRVPFYSSYAFYSPLGHVSRFTPASFDSSYFANMFKVNYRIKYFVEKKSGILGIVHKFFDHLSNKHTYFYCRALAHIFPSSEIEYFLTVKK